MRYFEYRLHYHVNDDVMESTKYTMAEDTATAQAIFVDMVPDETKDWDYMEKFCPYRNEWVIEKQYNDTISHANE